MVFTMRMQSLVLKFTLTLIVSSFVDVTVVLLGIPGVTYLFSERFCQDPLEAFFGKQRYKGSLSDNPSVKEFIDNTVSLGSAANSSTNNEVCSTHHRAYS